MTLDPSLLPSLDGIQNSTAIFDRIAWHAESVTDENVI